MSKSDSVRMTEGSVSGRILRFAFPVFCGNLFQQLYNVVDSVVVGNFVGEDALAAVSSAGNLIFLMVGLITGIFMGAGVVISRYYGARQEKMVERAVHTSVGFAVAASVVMTAAGLIFVPPILRMMGTPDSVLPNSILYFRIYFGGIGAVMLYNAANGIFQAVGDSRHPLYYLAVSSVVNVVLDLLFVAVFQMGVGGAALATVLSQAVCAVLAFARLGRIQEEYRVRWSKVRMEWAMLKEILRMGLPSGVQNSIIAFANIIVQTNINAFGAGAVAGCGSYSKLEGFAFLPITSFSLAMTTFIGQNLGAGEYERAKKGARFGILLSVLLAEAVAVVMYVFAGPLIGIFNSSPDTVAYGVLQIYTISIFYFLLSYSHCVSGILRGAGKAVIPMLVMIASWCVIRVSYITVITRFIHEIQAIFWAFPITWSISSLILMIYYFKADWIHGFAVKK